MITRSPNTRHGRGTPQSGGTGGGGLPVWVPAPNTVAAIPEVNSFASINPGTSANNGWSYWAEGLNVGSLVGSGAWWGAVIDAYSSGVYNPYFSVSGGALGSMIYHGGGHGDSNWSGIVAFDLNTLTYSIVKGGTLDGAPADTVNCEFADGQPFSHHSYDNLVILGPESGYSKGALAMPLMMAAGEASYNTNACHIYDFNNPGAGFVRKSAHNSFFNTSPGGAAAYDPDLGRIWWKANVNQAGYQQYFDLATNAHLKIDLSYAASLPSCSPDSATMRYDSVHNLVILIDVSGTTRRVFYFNTTTPTVGWAQATLSAAFPGAGAGQGFSFDKAADGTYLCNVQADLSKVYRLTIPAILTDPWVVTPITYSGTALGSAYVLGKRWSYIPALESFVCKPSAAVVHQIYRP